MTGTLTTDEELRQLLVSTRTIAVVGLSDQRGRPSFGVAKYLLSCGYEIIPVNPNIETWEGIPAFPTVNAIGRKVDMVDVFRRPEFVVDVVKDAITAGAGAVWTQLGVVNDEATKLAVDAGMTIVVDHCTAIEHRRLVGVTGPRI